MCRAGEQAYCVAGEVSPTEVACVRPANACPTRCAAGLALGALKLPDMRCVEVVCGADGLEATEPGAAESGDPARCAAVRGEAAADAGEAKFVGLEAAPDVGSWFCISVTSSVRKSLAETVAELVLESLELLVLLVPDVALAMGVAALRVSACPAVIW